MVRRLLLIAGASLLALPVAAQSANPQRASAQLDRCHASLDAAQRYAVFSGVMRSLRAGQDRMDMRFDLFRRAPGALAFKRVAAPGLGVWKRADPGVGRLKFKQKVENLTAPAAYRAVVSFRWIGADGRVFARAQHLTLACAQPDLRPDLRVVRMTYSPGTYAVTVRNAGRSPARGFGVGLSVGAVPVVPSQTVGLLASGEDRTLDFSGPRCASVVTATVDAGNAVAESNEANNTLTATCDSLGARRAR
jgi:hypothetical protein